MSAKSNQAAPSVILDVDKVRRTYGSLVALDELSFSVGKGEFVALVGHNGSGKSTMFGMTAGLIEPSTGTIRIDGNAAGSLVARSLTSYLPDVPVFYEDLSLSEHLEYIARMHGVSDWTSHADQLIEMFSLGDRQDDLPTHFSRGMKQKASIAMAFIRPFELLLADEPFDGLDPASRAVLLDLLDSAVTNGSSVIVSTHQMEVVGRSARCLGLSDGQLSYDGPSNHASVAQLMM